MRDIGADIHRRQFLEIASLAAASLVSPAARLVAQSVALLAASWDIVLTTG